jgi:hypothetical protein
MTRELAVTVRLPGVKIAPTSKTLACSQTGLENSGAALQSGATVRQAVSAIEDLSWKKWSSAYAVCRFFFKEKKWPTMDKCGFYASTCHFSVNKTPL